MPTHQQIHQARRNGTSSGQFVQGRSINVHHTVDLLITGPGLADATHPWQAPGQPSGPGPA